MRNLAIPSNLGFTNTSSGQRRFALTDGIAERTPKVRAS